MKYLYRLKSSTQQNQQSWALHAIEITFGALKMAIIFTLNHHPSSQTRATEGMTIKIDCRCQWFHKRWAQQQQRDDGDSQVLETVWTQATACLFLESSDFSSFVFIYAAHFYFFLDSFDFSSSSPPSEDAKSKTYTRMHAVSTHCEPASDKRCFLL